MEQYIIFLKQYFEIGQYEKYKSVITVALQSYFGANEQPLINQALAHLQEAFSENGTGINTFSISAQNDGSMRLTHNFEFTIRAEYLGLIPVLAIQLGYRQVEV